MSFFLLLLLLLLVGRTFRLLVRGMVLFLTVLWFGVLGLGVASLGVASRSGTRLLVFGGHVFRGRVLWRCVVGCRAFRSRVWRHRPFYRTLRWPRAHLSVLRRLRRALLRARLGPRGINMTCRSVVPLSIPVISIPVR